MPFAAGVDAGVGANGADDGVAAGVDAVGFFDEKFEGAADVLAAAIEEAGGARVTVDDPSFGDVKFLGDVNGMLPAEKFLVDFVAIGMLADLAFAGWRSREVSSRAGTRAAMDAGVRGRRRGRLLNLRVGAAGGAAAMGCAGSGTRGSGLRKSRGMLAWVAIFCRKERWATRSASAASCSGVRDVGAGAAEEAGANGT